MKIMEPLWSCIERTYLILVLARKENRRLRKYAYCRRSHFARYIICIFMIFAVSLLLLYPIQFNAVQIIEESNFNGTIILNDSHRSIHRIYVDIGCFDGETIEHFIYFTPNSSLYDIITFEPDPLNYELCKKRLKRKRYENYNIIIIPKVAWIRNEKVPYRTNLGRMSRIDLNNGHNLTKLDAIDFSSWLSDLIKSNRAQVHVKIGLDGYEVAVMQKLVDDHTVTLAETWDIQWADRSNPRIRPIRFYVQLMLDSYGFSIEYLTRLRDIRKAFKTRGTDADVQKYTDWALIPEEDTFIRYVQRPRVTDMPRTTRVRRKQKKL